MMGVHQDATPRNLHSITHLDDAPWAFAPSFRTAHHQASFEPERWGGAGRSPFVSSAPPCPRHTCAPAETAAGGYAYLAPRHRCPTASPRRSGWAGLGRATAGSHRKTAANDPRAS